MRDNNALLIYFSRSAIDPIVAARDPCAVWLPIRADKPSIRVFEGKRTRWRSGMGECSFHLCLCPLRKVAEDCREQLSAAALRPRNRNLKGNLLAIRPRPPNDPHVFHFAAGSAGRGKEAYLLGVPLAKSVRDKSRQRCSQSLGGRTAKHPLRRRVENHDPLAFIHRNDRIHRGLNDRGHLPVVYLRRVNCGPRIRNYLL